MQKILTYIYCYDKIIVVKEVKTKKEENKKLLQVNSEKHYIFISKLRI